MPFAVARPAGALSPLGRSRRPVLDMARSLCSGGSEAMSDYPAAITAVNHVEPVPRRIRAFLGGEQVLDTTRAMYVWEWPYYPQYYIPLADVRQHLLAPEGHTQQTGRGLAELRGLRVGDLHRPRAARVLAESPIGGLSGTVRFDWAALD